ncbi:hypothetical protein KAH55_01835, partial [bacterium]|nr:hypothetical protein [bacterium]
MKKKWRELLYLSLDNALTAAEGKTLTGALTESTELRNEKQQLLQMRTEIHQQKTATFKPFFSTRVMHQIDNL